MNGSAIESEFDFLFCFDISPKAFLSTGKSICLVKFEGGQKDKSKGRNLSWKKIQSGIVESRNLTKRQLEIRSWMKKSRENFFHV